MTSFPYASPVWGLSLDTVSLPLLLQLDLRDHPPVDLVGANRQARIWAQVLASPESSATQPPPWAWMAMIGAFTSIMAISALA